MGRMTLTLPRLGETMEEARVTDWLVAPGAAFKRGDVLLEVETDKTVVEVPALTDGTLSRQLVAPGDMVALDQPIAEVEVAGAADTPPPTDANPPSARTPDAKTLGSKTLGSKTLGSKTLGARLGGHPETGGYPATLPHRPKDEARSAAQNAQATTKAHRPAASPAARAAARRLDVDLASLSGTGRRGRITGGDVGSVPQSGIALHRSGTQGPVIVLLHGLFDDHRGWRDLPRRLASLGHRVLVPDLPGHGDSSAKAESLAAATHLIDQALPRGPLHLIGHSLGGAIATGLAQRRGDDIRSLTLLAPAGLGPAINPDFLDGMLRADTPAALAQALGLLDGGPISAMALEQELTRLIAARPYQTDLARALAGGGQQKIDITADLAQLRCPLRVVFGTKDQILNWQDVARLPARAAIHLVAGAGHLPHFAAPDLIASFFAQEENAQSISA